MFNWKKAVVLMVTVLAVGVFSTAMAAEIVVDQKNKTFVKSGKKVEKLKVKVGDTISFKNQDPFFHNIFSLSDIKTFDLGSYPTGQAKSVTMDKAGISEIECAIHPHMFLTVEVSN